MLATQSGDIFRDLQLSKYCCAQHLVTQVSLPTCYNFHMTIAIILVSLQSSQIWCYQYFNVIDNNFETSKNSSWMKSHFDHSKSLFANWSYLYHWTRSCTVWNKLEMIQNILIMISKSTSKTLMEFEIHSSYK